MNEVRPTPEPTITSVTWVPEGLIIAYLQPTDVRVRGHLMAQHSLSLHRDHPDYHEDIVKLHDRVVGVLRNALEDFETSEPWDGDDEDDDDERGMGE
jgi:hypothetical protein